MKKNFLISIIFSLICSCPMANSAVWDDYSGLDRIWDGQKSITNKEFDEAINVLEKNKQKKEAKQRKKTIKKIGGGGTSLHNELNPDKEIKELSPLKKDGDCNILNIPVDLKADDSILEKGFYKVVAEKENKGELYFLFYQSQYLKGKIKAQETQEDFDEDDLNFVKLIPFNDNFVKIIYGSLDYNAKAYVQISQ